jgi:hypothetical protein
VMQASTVVINPPDGDMAAYLASLRELAERGPRMAGAGARLPDGRAEAGDRMDHRAPPEARGQGSSQRCRARPARPPRPCCRASTTTCPSAFTRWRCVR